jgi:threonyl-tRNA synthetase
MMREVAERAGLEVYDGIGEAAFYAPKLDFMAYDSLGREWQLATIQLDLNFADRFDLKYVDSDGTFKRPVIIHRAILGSVERFMSILIEHYAGNFPTWLTPVQVKVLPISEKQLDYAREVEIKLKAENIRVELDERSETLGNKIRQVQAEKVAYMLILGDKEKESNTISVRSRTGEETKAVSITDFINQITTEIKNKSL